MDKSVARHIVMESFTARRHLENLLHFMKLHCSDEEYQTYLKACAHSIATIGHEIDNRVFALFPEMEKEVEESVKRYGRYI